MSGFSSGWETLIFMAPFGVLLAMSVFGLDEQVARKRQTTGRRRVFCEVQPEAEPVLRDPDGRVWDGSSRW